MILDPVLSDTRNLENRLAGLFQDGRIFFMRYPGMMQGPEDFEPMFMKHNEHVLGVICTAGHVDAPAFDAWLRSLGVSRDQFATTSVSNLSAFMNWVLISRLRRPMLEGFLVNPPKSATLALAPGHRANSEYALMMPSLKDIKAYFVANGASPTDFDGITRSIPASTLGVTSAR